MTPFLSSCYLSPAKRGFFEADAAAGRGRAGVLGKGHDRGAAMQRISAVLLARDEEGRIQNCLRSLGWVDQIVVVDTGSRDRTLVRARQFTDDIVSGDIGLGFAHNRNLGNLKARNDWILKIDADEVVTDELAQEIRRRVGSEPGTSGYTAATRTHFRRQWIRGCGWYPMMQIRVFDKRQGTWEGRVHERLVFRGETSRLQNDFLHFSYDDIEHYLRKFNLYTTFEAEGMIQRGRRVRCWDLPSLFFFRPAGFFLRSFVLRRGWRDGFYGFVVSLLGSVYVLVKYLKLWELQRVEPTRNLFRDREVL